MQSLKFKRQNGRIPKSLPGMDHVSGMLFYTSDGVLPEDWGSNPILMFGALEEAEAKGIKPSEGVALDIRMIHYHLQQFWRINPGATLYVAIFNKRAENLNSFEELKVLQNYSGGEIRQVGVWNGFAALSATEITALQGVATTLEEEDTPLSIVYSPYVAKLSELELTYAGENKKNITIAIGQDWEGVAPTLQAEYVKASVGAVGVVLGTISKSAIHESIAWVERFPTGIALAGFPDGTLLRDTSKALLRKLDEARYVFFVTYNGLNGVYINDSHNLDSAQSDYCQIELVRTMDKAVRGVRTYLLPELGRPLYIDPETGKLAPETVKHLENITNKPLEEMEKAGELSGCRVTIDPDQNVLGTSEVQFIIDNVAVGVFRRGAVKIGYAASI